MHGSASPPPPRPPPPPSASPHLNLRGLVFNFFKKSFCGSFSFSVADFLSRTKSFKDIEDYQYTFQVQFLNSLIERPCHFPELSILLLLIMITKHLSKPPSLSTNFRKSFCWKGWTDLTSLLFYPSLQVQFLNSLIERPCHFPEFSVP